MLGRHPWRFGDCGFGFSATGDFCFCWCGSLCRCTLSLHPRVVSCQPRVQLFLFLRGFGFHNLLRGFSFFGHDRFYSKLPLGVNLRLFRVTDATAEQAGRWVSRSVWRGKPGLRILSGSRQTYSEPQRASANPTPACCWLCSPATSQPRSDSD